MKTNLPTRQRWLLIIAGTGALLLALDRVVFTPLDNTWTAHTKEISQLKHFLDNGRSLITRSASLQRTWADMQKGALAKDPAQSERDLISAFDGWGRTTNVELGSIKPQWKAGVTDGDSLLECRVDASGSYASLGRFLYEVEKSPLALKIESVEITARDETGQKVALALMVSGLRFSPLEAKT